MTSSNLFTPKLEREAAREVEVSVPLYILLEVRKQFPETERSVY